MNIYLNDNIDLKYVIYQKPIQNKLEMYKNFYKIVYSHPKYTMNYLLIPLNVSSYNLELYNGKYRLIVNKNDPIFSQIFEIEKNILTSLNMVTKKNIKYQCIFDLRNKKHFFIFHQIPNLHNLCLKISGVWEDDNNIGIIYKLFYYSSPPYESSLSTV